MNQQIRLYVLITWIHFKIHTMVQGIYAAYLSIWMVHGDTPIAQETRQQEQQTCTAPEAGVRQ